MSHPTPEQPDRANQEPSIDPELVAWLEANGLTLDDVLAVIPNDTIDKLEPSQIPLVHGLLEAGYVLRKDVDHQDSEIEELPDK